MYKKVFNFAPIKRILLFNLLIGLLFAVLFLTNIISYSSYSYKNLLITAFCVILVSVILYNLEYNETKFLRKKFYTQHKLMFAIINNAPFTIFIKDLAGNILLANDCYYDFAQRNENNKNINDVYEDINVSRQEDADVIRNKKCLFIERYVSLKNGKSGWRKIIKVPVFDKNNNVSNIVVMAVNIDEERKLQDCRLTLVATLTHDLKTPITAQISALNLLLNNNFGCLNSSQLELLSQIKDSCAYSKNLVDIILDTYLYEKGQIELFPERFSLTKLIDEAIESTLVLAKDKSQKVVNSSNFSDYEIFADKFQLKRVITNLISNAIRYGFPNSTIEILAEQNSDKLFFNVKSFSKYIKSKNLKTIYDKFQTFSEQKSSSSCGLGLYLVKQIITAHKGYVFAQSEKNGFCNFGFVIPCKNKLKNCSN